MARPRLPVGADRPLLPARRCVDCGELFQKTWKSARCYPCQQKKQQERCRGLQIRVYLHYGSGICECSCCHESRIEFLTIDHVGGGGADHQREFKAASGYTQRGWRICEWLIKQGFPEGFRVLCANCNHARGYYGYCPHDKERESAIAGSSTTTGNVAGSS